VLKNTTTLAALLLLLTLLAAPLALAQLQNGTVDPISPPDKGTGVLCVECDRGGQTIRSDPGNIDSTGLGDNGAGFLQYSAGPSPVVPPGYQRIGDYYCPTFDPHGPPCFRVP
jgi:hypothetical protein